MDSYHKLRQLRLILVCAGTWAGLVLPAWPTEGARDGLTLESALEMALTHNPNLRAGSGRVDAATGRAYQARQWPNPELEFATEELPVRDGSFSDSKNTIGVAQTVPWPGKKKLDGRIGMAEVRRAEWDLNQQKLELVRDVKAAFFRVLSVEKQVLMAEELARVAERSAVAARKRVEAGAAADQEQFRTEILLEQARAGIAGFKRELAAARQELATTLGRPDLESVRLSGSLAESPSALPELPEQKRSLDRHPALASARAAREQAGLELRRARLEPYPDVRLGVDGGREGSTDTPIVEFRVSLPLPILDRSKGARQEAEANFGIAEAELAATEQQLLRIWATARQRFDTAAEQVAIYRDSIVPKANAALRLIQTGFDEGKFTLIDLLDIQRTAAETRLAYQEKLLELNLAHADLEALVGGPRHNKLTISRHN